MDHPIILMQCGAIRFSVNAKKQAAARPFDHVVIPRFTHFRIAPGTPATGINDIYSALTNDSLRNRTIYKDILEAIKRGRSSLVLTERTEHLKLLASMLETAVTNVIILQGGIQAINKSGHNVLVTMRGGKCCICIDRADIHLYERRKLRSYCT